MGIAGRAVPSACPFSWGAGKGSEDKASGALASPGVRESLADDFVLSTAPFLLRIILLSCVLSTL